jgi:hypothetical protein
VPVAPAAVAPLSEWAAVLPEPLASAVRARTEGARRFAIELQKSNRLAAIVARDLQEHMRSVFDTLADMCRDRVGYDPSGREQKTAARAACLDAVG